MLLFYSKNMDPLGRRSSTEGALKQELGEDREGLYEL